MNRTDEAFLFGVMWGVSVLGIILMIAHSTLPDWLRTVLMLFVFGGMTYGAIKQRARDFALHPRAKAREDFR
jgi:uncharacterized membrane protein YccC